MGRGERRPRTDSNCLCLLVWGDLNQSLRSCALEIRPNDVSAEKRRGRNERKGFKSGSKGGGPPWRRLKELFIREAHPLRVSLRDRQRLRNQIKTRASAEFPPWFSPQKTHFLSPVDHLSTSRFTSCHPPTPLLPSNRRYHNLSGCPKVSEEFISPLVFALCCPRVLCLMSPAILLPP